MARLYLKVLLDFLIDGDGFCKSILEHLEDSSLRSDALTFIVDGNSTANLQLKVETK